MKKIALWLLTLALTFAGLAALSGCQFIENDSDDTLYVINTDEFNSTVVYGESVSLDGLKIVQTKDGVTTEIPVNTSMITAPADVNRVGVTEMKVTYDGHEFSVPVSVKYRVTLKADGEIIETLYVMTAAELASISAPEKAGYIFDGWNPEIPNTLTENITLEAKYIGAAPALTELKATYGDKLGDLTLPSTAAGKWVFNTPDNTVGDAGKREAAVSFVLNSTGEVLKTDVVKINVAKRTVNFTDVSKSLVYNGEKQIPTYTADANVNIVFYEESGFNYTDAGIYPYYFEVNDPNYEGELEGTYEITKASVTIKIGSYTILASEKLPEITYEILGFENESILGLSVTDPEDVVNGAGVYTLTATVSNPNVDLTVENGTLTVISTVLDVGAPKLSSSTATYGDKLSTLTFETHHNGRWAWQTPDAEVGNVGTRTHVAVFTPNDPRYDTLTYNVDITVNAKPLNIEIPDNGNVFTYDGTEKILTYVIKDDDGNVYDLEVLGNTPFKDAGTYDRILTFANNNYTSNNKKVNIVVHKANPTPTFSTELSTVWSSTLKLMDIQLPAGCEWLNPDAKVEKAGKTYPVAIYTHEDTKNYNPIQITFTVTAEKATATINNVNNSYSFTYTGSDINLSGISASHEESELSYAYTLDGVAVSAIKNVGTYTVTITLAGTDNYKPATATTTVTVFPASNTDDVMLYQKATYGDKLSALKLPSSEVGTWSWKNANADTTVGNAGENKFTAIFTPANGNYNSREVIITVTVDKKKIDAPSIAEKMRRQAYTGDRIYSGLISSEGYTVTDDGGISKGTYTATLVLDTTNYVWSDGSSESKTLTYEIVEAANEWTSAPTIKPSWTYGDTAALDKNSDEYKAYLGSATAKYGTVTITYALAGTDSFSAELPTDAGKYIARFTAIHTDAATKSEDVPFEILKKAVDIPSYTGSYVYTGTGINAGISATELYDVADELRTDAGSYTAKLTLRYPSNYVWADGDTSASKNLPYTISKANAVIEDFAIGNVKFGEPLAPTATVSLGAAYRFMYSDTIDGTYSATAPTAVGTYFVKVSVTGNENILASESAPVQFVISRADVTISGYQNSYEKVYDGKVFAFTGVTASNGAEVKFSVKKDGADAEIKNAGVYSVTIYTEENESYNASSVTVTVTVKAADNTDTVKVTQSAVYGDKLATLELPVSEFGTWSWKDADENTTVGNAGENKFTAIFTPANGNYNAREVEVTVNVAKAILSVPTPSHSVYDGAHHNSGITETELYSVVDAGGEDKGTYTVNLTLKFPENYKWDISSDATVSVEYHISEALNGWASEPTLKTPAEYGSTDNLAYAEAEHGGVLIEYKSEGEDDDKYTTVAPTVPGKYTVRFTTTDENYTKLTVIKSLEITKKKITAPAVTVTEFAYTGEKITLGLAASEYYTVSDEGSINAKSGIVATLTLNSDYYVWADGTEGLVKEYTYAIIPTTNAVTAPTIEGWTYGEDANAPTGSSDSFGCEIYYVYSSAENGEYTTAVPTNANTYYVKAVAKATANVNGAESSPVSFTIAKAQTSIEGYEENYTQTYNGTNFTFDDKGITASNGAALEYAITKDGENVSAIKNAGVYTVTITLPESANYLGAEANVTVTIEKIANTDTIPTYSATYGDKLSTLTVPSSSTGDWKWKDITDTTTVGDAGNREHTLVFTPDDETNYASREVTVTVTVAKATISTPTAKNPTNVYANVTHTSGLTDTELYTVLDNGGITVGTYTATLTLTDSANYAWDSVSNESATTSVSYEITAGTNSITGAAINGWTYGETGNTGSATAKYGDIAITYKAEGEDDSKYTATLPKDAGNYVARFTTTDTNCPIISETRTFTIQAATVNVPAASTVYYNGEVQFGGFASTEIYTVIGEGGTNVGDYTLTLALTDKINYKWNTTGNANDVTVSFEILKTTVTFSGLSAGWTYDNPKEPTVTVSHEFAKQYVTFLYSSDGGTSWSAEKPTEVGTYKVKATITATSNYEAEEKQADFTIDRAAPTFAAPSFAGGKHYQNQLDLSTDGFKAYNNGKEVSGSFGFGDVSFADGANASSVTLTFTPDNTTNFKPTSVTYTMTLVSVAYLNNSTAYGTIEEAVKEANLAGSGTVWVRPHDPELGPIVITGYDKEIDGKTIKVLEIYSGVTLLLPFGTDSSGRNKIDSSKQLKSTIAGNPLAGEDLCITKVVLASKVRIINSGIIEISGELSGGSCAKGDPNGLSTHAGHTAGKHARLILGEDAILESNSGSTVYCAGFILEETKNNGSAVILNDGATIYQPFVLRDFRGGDFLFALYNELETMRNCPIYKFQAINITSTIRFNYGASFIAWANLYTQALNTHATTTVAMIGSNENNSNAIIKLTDKTYSYISAKYDVDTDVCDLGVFGGASMNPMKLDMVFYYVYPVKINTTVCLFPISYFYNITLDVNKDLEQTSAEFHMDQSFKLLPGASLTVEKGATLYINEIIIIDEYNDKTAAADSPFRYPDGLAPANLTVNGKLVANKIGGAINSSAEGAQIVINQEASFFSNEVVSWTADGFSSKVNDWYVITRDTTLAGTETITASIGVYNYVDGKWIYMQISFNSDGGTSIAPTYTETNLYPALTSPEKVGHVFIGWFYGDTQVREGDTLLVYGQHTLTARWRKLTWVTLDTAFEDIENSIIYIDSTTNAVYPELPTLEKEGYEFLGWFYGDEQVSAAGDIKTADDHTLTAKWRRKIAVTLDSAFDDIADSVIYVDSAASNVYAGLTTLEKEGYTFLGWYLGDTLINNGDTLTTEEDHTLTAKWRRKVVITLDSTFDDVADSTLYVDAVDSGVYPTLPVPTKDGSTFLGWFYDGVQVNAGDLLKTDADHTLTAMWKTLSPIGLDGDGDGTADSYVYVDFETDTTYPALTAPAAKEGHTFAGWTYNGESVAAGDALKLSEAHTLTAAWTVNSYTVTVTTTAATVTGVANGDSIPYGTEVSITVSFNKSIKSLVVKDAAGNKLLDKTANGTYTFTMPASAVTITATSEDACVTADTLVTLADGAQKRIDSVTSSDMLLVWNFFEGKYDSAPAAILFNHEYASNTVIKLNFSDGTSVKVVNLHQFLSAETNSFVEINSDTVESLIGHSFIKQSGDGTTTVELVDYSITEEYVEAYGIISAFHYNIIVEGLISTDIMPEDQPLFNYFEIGDDMRFDEEKMQSDIEKYGLYTYEDFAEHLTYEQFIAFNIQYMKISVGKGAYTYEGILDLIDYYLNK